MGDVIYEPEIEIYEDLGRFTWWVNVAGEYTRSALEMMNEHLESE